MKDAAGRRRRVQDDRREDFVWTIQMKDEEEEEVNCKPWRWEDDY